MILFVLVLFWFYSGSSFEGNNVDLFWNGWLVVEEQFVRGDDGLGGKGRWGVMTCVGELVYTVLLEWILV